MQSLWNAQEAQALGEDLLALRVYTSQLLGREESLVLHGGGNTSVKARVTDFYGVETDVLYVKGSGWDLATIEKAGFAPVRLNALLHMATLESLSDGVMVREQRASMLNPDSPTPSVEAILHAVIPFVFVDHTHADAVVTLTNCPEGEARIRALYGERVLIIPYVMPGFVLAREIYQRIRQLSVSDWARLEGMILLNHGIFTFGNTAQESYERMVRLVTEAENALNTASAWDVLAVASAEEHDLVELAMLRREVSRHAKRPLLARLDDSAESVGFANLPTMPIIARQGCLTPDHIIRTKRIPLVVRTPIANSVSEYAESYRAYFDRNTDGRLTMLDPAPRWAVWQKRGIVAFGETVKACGIVSDITHHTIQAIQRAEALGGWRALPEKDLFEMEYWELEQAKLKKNASRLPLEGKVALVTGGASGIGLACVVALAKAGCAVVALDINPNTPNIVQGHQANGMVCDVTQEHALKKAIRATVKHYGGLDIVVSNAGIFPPSMSIETMDSTAWDKSLAINLTAHQRLWQVCIPYLKQGIDPTLIVIASKNVPAPGNSAGAYSAAKAALTQLARVAALEWASAGVRVNVVHPDAVFDTGIWSDDIIAKRAESYGMSVEEYKTKNLLKTTITSSDVARLVVSLAGEAFSKTTGAQVPIDGGNDRVI